MITALLLAQAPVHSTRAETLLNGTRIFIERSMDSPTCSFQVWCMSTGATDSTGTLGLRHLLEHLAGRGPSNDIDRRLEAKGIMLTAETNRDAMIFRIDCRAEHQSLAIAALREVLMPITVSQEVVDREKKIIEHELALRPRSVYGSTALWVKEYPVGRFDPGLTSPGFWNASLEEVRLLQARHFSAENVIVSVAGPVDLEATKSLVKQAFLSLPTSTVEIAAPEAAVEFPEFKGGAVGVRVPGLNDPAALAQLGVGLALTQAIPESRLIYTPSLREGMMVITSPAPDLKDQIRQLSVGYVRFGNNFVRNYLTQWRKTAGGMAASRALCLTASPPANTEDLMRTASTLSDDHILASFEAWKDGLTP